MSTYAIGDVQGCYLSLQALLEKLGFDPKHDTLWFVGDLVNRGPRSLETLRYIQSLENAAITVLGNHDIHLLAAGHDSRHLHHEDTLQAILTAPDSHELLTWLQQRPLLHHDAMLGYTLVHAGIHPLWDLAQAQNLAHEVETVLRSEKSSILFENLYGDEPHCWNEDLSGISRWRYVINVLTRMRFCDVNGCLNFTEKSDQAPENFFPWFQVPNRKMASQKIIFGHWSSLNGLTQNINAIALDTGCVWGQKLTAFCLESKIYTDVPYQERV